MSFPCVSSKDEKIKKQQDMAIIPNKPLLFICIIFKNYYYYYY